MQKLKGALALACTSLLVACGGGGSANDTQPESVPHPEGRYDGYVFDASGVSTGRTGQALVIGARSFWLFYSAPGNPALIGGVVHADIAAISTAAFTSANGRDFNFEGFGVTPGTGTAKFVPRASIDVSGSSLVSGAAGSFVGAYNGTFAQTPTLAAIAGTYVGTAATAATGRQAGSGTITADGAFSGSSGGCISTGTFTPRPAADDNSSTSPRYGGNAYDVVLNFGGVPCAYPGQTWSGVAMYDADTKSILVAAVNPGRTDAAAFAGTKP
jgi:hypothetical protein